MLKVCRLFVVLLACVACFAPRAGRAYIDKEVAVLQVMDKAAGKTQTVTARIGQVTGFEKLNLVVRACKQSDPFEAENFYAFTEIAKSDGTKVYGNWMDRNNPGKNPVQNADYDIWLVRCE